MGAMMVVVALTTPSEASPAQLGMVEGVVTGLPTGLGLPNVAVTLKSDTAPWSEVHTTDVRGSFKFANLPAGLYSIEARSTGWLGVSISPVVVVPGTPVLEHLEMTSSPVEPIAPIPQPSRT